MSQRSNLKSLKADIEALAKIEEVLSKAEVALGYLTYVKPLEKYLDGESAVHLRGVLTGRKPVGSGLVSVRETLPPDAPNHLATNISEATKQWKKLCKTLDGGKSPYHCLSPDLQDELSQGFPHPLMAMFKNPRGEEAAPLLPLIDGFRVGRRVRSALFRPSEKAEAFGIV